MGVGVGVVESGVWLRGDWGIAMGDCSLASGDLGRGLDDPFTA